MQDLKHILCVSWTFLFDKDIKGQVTFIEAPYNEGIF
jgi:hypothetical protein